MSGLSEADLDPASASAAAGALMAHYRGAIDSKRSVEETFDYMADFRSVTEWDPTAIEAEMLGDGPGEGTRFRVVVRLAGRENEFLYTTLEYERPRRFVLRAETSTVVSEDTVTVDAVPDRRRPSRLRRRPAPEGTDEARRPRARADVQAPWRQRGRWPAPRARLLSDERC